MADFFLLFGLLFKVNKFSQIIFTSFDHLHMYAIRFEHDL